MPDMASVEEIADRFFAEAGLSRERNRALFIAALRQREREVAEECAKIAEDSEPIKGSSNHIVEPWEIAAAIRNRFMQGT